uniref:Uncharacterized protein n=1 Tax=Arsenophonus nasoniae TaxID=638 RepID=D2TXR0_9GAMM|nr:hypothetical protein ARN_08890 [Arsenophonus nasoniae]
MLIGNKKWMFFFAGFSLCHIQILKLIIFSKIREKLIVNLKNNIVIINTNFIQKKY